MGKKNEGITKQAQLIKANELLESLDGLNFDNLNANEREKLLKIVLLILGIVKEDGTIQK